LPLNLLEINAEVIGHHLDQLYAASRNERL
jgi:hypothetical protein